MKDRKSIVLGIFLVGGVVVALYLAFSSSLMDLVGPENPNSDPVFKKTVTYGKSKSELRFAEMFRDLVQANNAQNFDEAQRIAEDILSYKSEPLLAFVNLLEDDEFPNIDLYNASRYLKYQDYLLILYDSYLREDERERYSIIDSVMRIGGGYAVEILCKFLLQESNAKLTDTISPALLAIANKDHIPTLKQFNRNAKPEKKSVLDAIISKIQKNTDVTLALVQVTQEDFLSKSQSYELKPYLNSSYPPAVTLPIYRKLIDIADKDAIEAVLVGLSSEPKKTQETVWQSVTKYVVQSGKDEQFLGKMLAVADVMIVKAVCPILSMYGTEKTIKLIKMVSLDESKKKELESVIQTITRRTQ